MGIKWIGAILIFVGCVGVGIWFRMQYAHKLAVVKECGKAFSLLQGEIQYGRTPLPEACYAVAGRTKGSCRTLFYRVGEKMMEGSDSTEVIWQEEVRSTLNDREMRLQDQEEILRLGTTLGYLDLELQYRTLELCIQRLEESRDSYEKERRNRMRLYPLLGTFAGLLICLVLG